MILDENFEAKISPVRISHAGDFAIVDTLEFRPPQPRMAKSMFLMRKYFTQIQKDALKAVASMQGVQEVAQQYTSLEAGEPVKATYEEYKDGDPEARESKIKSIEDMISGFNQAVDMCDSVDLFQFTEDFGKMVITDKRCVLKLEEGMEPLTAGIWSQQIQPDDRLKLAIRYCCFFGLTSSTLS